ncbi:MAG: endonuclease III [Candidatus Hydrogenedentes bacterium]|nr:endonuclease III [Candidatus Hydrogenedentota bacterium]
MAKVKRTQAATRKRAVAVLERLRQAYPDARCTLDYTNPLELLVATILAAQCTDARVNEVTKPLFKQYRTAADYADAPQDELEQAVVTCGFYRNKARNIRKACGALVARFGGTVPETMEELLELDGVGRKTANVLLGECAQAAGVVVDTHCGRVARRLGLTRQTDPVKVEQDLMKVWPQEAWTIFSHSLVFHGRAVCQARSPRCSACCVKDLCPFPDTAEGKRIAR